MPNLDWWITVGLALACAYILTGLITRGPWAGRGWPGFLRWLALMLIVAAKRTALHLRLIARNMEQTRRKRACQVRRRFWAEHSCRLRGPRSRHLKAKPNSPNWAVSDAELFSEDSVRNQKRRGRDR